MTYRRYLQWLTDDIDNGLPTISTMAYRRYLQWLTDDIYNGLPTISTMAYRLYLQWLTDDISYVVFTEQSTMAYGRYQLRSYY
jgi:hypothetical protein